MKIENSGINFNKPYCSEIEEKCLMDSVRSRKICGDGKYTVLCNDWFRENISRKALLTHSCTAALEMTAILLNLEEGDEIIMPSYTFVSTANPFVLRGAKPVFVDVRKDTLNIDEKLIEAAITDKTKAIVPVHYAGVASDMDAILSIANKFELKVIEDAAQGFMSFYKGLPLGSIGDLGTYSFHETKNIVSGEGGALIINNNDYIERAEIIREKGTNRSQFYRGQVDKYTWVDIGSSYLASDIIASYLWAQLGYAKELTKKRLELWAKYHKFFEKYENLGFISRPIIPDECTHNAHMYYILFKDTGIRPKFIDFLKNVGISTVFHYVPLHSSPAGRKYGRVSNEMSVTDYVSDALVRMPMFYDLNEENLYYIFAKVDEFFKGF